MKDNLFAGIIAPIRNNIMVSLFVTLLLVVSIVSVTSTIYINKSNSRFLHRDLENTVTNSVRFAQLG
ncbi:MAG TPA: hypothetical protein ENN05_01330, partial [Deltaproteobacteria bacterium]|nr:hypothetical protein [Deltaproteobacteria bacterium]